MSLLKQQVDSLKHVYIATFWSDRQTGFTEVFRSLESAKRFCKRARWKSFGSQTWVCETTLGVYRIRRRRIRGRP